MSVLLVFAVLTIPLKGVIEMSPDGWRDYKFCLKKINANRTAHLLTLLWKYCRKGGLLPRPESGLLSNTLKWIVQRDALLTKQETLPGRGTGVERSRVRELKKTALPCGSQSRFYGNQVSFWSLSGQLLWLRVIPGGMFSLSQDGFQQEGFWEVGRTCGLESTLSFSLLLFPSPFPNSSSWW